MSFPAASYNINSNTTITNTYLNSIILVDATSGGVILTLDTPSNFGLGVVSIKKVDITSNLVKMVPTSGTFEEGRTSLPLSLEGDACMMFSDGSNWWLIGPGLSALRHNPIVAEHTITATSYNIDPTYNGYIMLCDCATAGNSILMLLPPINQAAFNHQTFTVFVEKFDTNTSFVVSVVSQSGDVIHDPRAVTVGASYKIDIAKPMQCLGFWTDGARWVVATSNGI